VTARTRRTIVLVIISALVVLPLAGIVLASERLLSADPDGRPLTILVLGSDAGPPRSDLTTTGRADGFQLVFVAGDRQHATIVSIPRDSWVPVPGFGDTKINACLTKGPENCVDTVENAFGIEVDAWFLTSMWGFAEAINEFVGCPLGGPEETRACDKGLTIDVDFSCTARCGALPIPESGLQQLSGYEALTYARYRAAREGGDFGRSLGQGTILATAHAEASQEGTVAKMMDAIRILRRHTLTDATLPQLVRYGLDAMLLPPANVEVILAPARPETIGPASAVRLLPAAYDLIAEAAGTGRPPVALRAAG
jgi:LCP family protein required for cell wall assembly